MMNVVSLDCQSAVREFRPYADGELDPETAGALTQHLSACSGCRAEFARRKEMFEFIARSYGAQRISGGFSAAAENRLLVGAAAPTALEGEAAEDEESSGSGSRGRAAGFGACLLATLGSLPWWALSGAFHGLLITVVVLVGWAILPHKIQEQVVITNLVQPKEAEKIKEQHPFDPKKRPVESSLREVVDAQVPFVTVEETEVQELDVSETETVEFAEDAGDEALLAGDHGERSGLGLGAGRLGRLAGQGVPIGGGRRGMVGKIGNVTFAGQRLALIFDNSYSMASVVQFAKEALVDFLAQARGKGTIAFYSEINQKGAHEFHRLKGVPLRSGKEKVLEWFEGLPKGGNNTVGEAASSVYWAFAEAMSEYPDMVIFVTDWKLHSPNREYNVKKQTEEIKKILKDQPKGQMPKLVFFTQTASGPLNAIMKELAEMTKGEVQIVRKTRKKKKN